MEIYLLYGWFLRTSSSWDLELPQDDLKFDTSLCDSISFLLHDHRVLQLFRWSLRSKKNSNKNYTRWAINIKFGWEYQISTDSGGGSSIFWKESCDFFSNVRRIKRKKKKGWTLEKREESTFQRFGPSEIVSETNSPTLQNLTFEINSEALSAMHSLHFFSFLTEEDDNWKI